MYVRGHPFVTSTSRVEDCRLAAAVGIILAAYVGLAFGFYWLMQPTIVANYGTGYQPLPKTVVHYASSPWVPPPPSEALATPAAAEPAPASIAAEEPKKEIKKQVARPIPRRPRPAAEPNPFFGFASSPSFGRRPWF